MRGEKVARQSAISKRSSRTSSLSCASRVDSARVSELRLQLRSSRRPTDRRRDASCHLASCGPYVLHREADTVDGAYGRLGGNPDVAQYAATDRSLSPAGPLKARW